MTWLGYFSAQGFGSSLLLQQLQLALVYAVGGGKVQLVHQVIEILRHAEKVVQACRAIALLQEGVAFVRTVLIVEVQRLEAFERQVGLARSTQAARRVATLSGTSPGGGLGMVLCQVRIRRNLGSRSKRYWK